MATNDSELKSRRARFFFSSIVPALAMRYPTTKRFQVVSIIGVSALIVAVGWLVFVTGGIQFAYAHAMYLPVLMGAWFFGWIGGLAAGIAGGIVLGPWMPVDVALGTMQLPLNWAFRLAMLFAIGAGTGYALDIVDHRSAHVRWLRSIDPITEIPNRLWLRGRLEAMIPEAPENSQIVLFAVNLDNYREIVDTFGPGAGDEIVCETMNRLRAELPAEAAAGRLETDRLGIVVHESHSPKSLTQMLKAAFWNPASYKGIPLYLDISIGMAKFPVHGTGIEELIQKAHFAMHRAQTRTDRFSVYDVELDRTSKKNLALFGELPDAIRNNDLRLHYQPIISVDDGRLVELEALVRWEHSSLGLVYPGRFIPQAENTGIVNSLTSWVLQVAMRQLSEWQQRGLEVRMAINMSARVLRNRDVITRVLSLADRYDLSRDLIDLEVTESAIMSSMADATDVLGELAEAGIRLSIDDFGTGYSSLQYLADLPVHTLKIDRVFVQGMGKHEGSRKIVEATAELADRLGLETVAEGVEYADDLRMLQEFGVDRAQGFAIARPQPSEELEGFLSERGIWTEST